MQFNFGQRSRLKNKRDFTGLKLRGQRLAMGCMVANWEQLEAGAESRLGVITSGKLGIAVERNRARRLLREAFRLHRHEFVAPMNLVLVARSSILGKRFSSVEKDFVALLRKAALLVNG